MLIVIKITMKDQFEHIVTRATILQNADVIKQKCFNENVPDQSIFKPRIIDGLSEIQTGYQGFLIDAWGVLHDGISSYPYALKCLQKLQERNKTVVILSNAARRCEAMVHELETQGIGSGLYQAVLSSGELAWHSMNARRFPGRRGFYLGPPRSRGLLEGLDLDWVDEIESADFILNAGAARGNPPTTGDSEALLKLAVDRDLPMICANPDLIAIRGGQAGISAGALARRYEELGANQIEYYGKPHRPIYQQALTLLGDIPPSRVLAIGDAFDTDIRGGHDAELDTCLIASGIHRDQLLPLAENTILAASSADAVPTYTSEYLSW